MNARSLNIHLTRLTSPYTWPVWLRRLFVVTFPIALPLAAIYGLGVAVAFIAAEFATHFGKLWNSPRKRLGYDHHGYDYGASKRRRSRPSPLFQMPSAE